jgi:hypothetical protein
MTIDFRKLIEILERLPVSSLDIGPSEALYIDFEVQGFPRERQFGRAVDPIILDSVDQGMIIVDLNDMRQVLGVEFK